ncbi:MAG: hypothetical protein M0R75_11820 [Dehalococcoidia bacterium]|nr:hypothetical protein [Dehalococcoidia bacterium]
MAATSEEIARALANGAPVRWRLLSCDRRGNLRALGDSTTADLSDALLWESGANPGLDGGRLDLDNDGREIPLQGTVRLDLARVPGGAGLDDISHVRLIEDRLVQPGGAGIRYETALSYWQRQAEQASGGGLWALSAAVGDALDLSGHGNDGTVTYAEGQRGVDGLYDRSDGAMRFLQGATNSIGNPVWGHGTYFTGWTASNITHVASTFADHPLAGFGVTSGITCTISGGGTFARPNGRVSVTDNQELVAVVLWRRKTLVTTNLAYIHVALYDADSNSLSSFNMPATQALPVSDDWYISLLSGQASSNAAAVATAEIRPSMSVAVSQAGSEVEIAYAGIIPASATFPSAAQKSADNDGKAATYLHEVLDPSNPEHMRWLVVGSMGTGYSWASTAHASASTRVASDVTVADDSAIEDIFDGGGAVGGLARVTSDGEGDAGTLASKGWTVKTVDEAGGLCRLQLTVPFSDTDGIWRTARSVPTADAADLLWLVLYDADATTNDPTIYVGNLDTETLTSLAITETQTPVGTRESDASIDLVVGNVPDGDETADAILGPVRLWQGTQPTEDEIAEFFALAQTARPTYTPAPAPEWVEFPRGIFVVSFADTTHPWDGRPIATLTLNDLTAHLLDTIGEAYTAASGTAYWDVVRELLEDYLGLLTDLPSGGPLLQQDFSRPRSWRFIDALRDLADGLNYHPVWPTALGRFTSRERANLALATAAVDYSDAQEPRMLDAGAPYVRKLDVPQVDNRRVVVADFGAEHIADPKYVIYENADPTSPVSTALTPVRLGDLRADTRPSTRAIYDKPTMAAIAQYELRLLDAKARAASFDTFPDPRRGNHEYYRVTVAGAETAQLVRCSGWSQQLKPGAPMSHSVQVVRPVALTELFEIDDEEEP